MVKYRQKCRIFFNFLFSCSNFDSHSKGQNFNVQFSRCVCKERRAILEFSESLIPKEPGIKF